MSHQPLPERKEALGLFLLILGLLPFLMGFSASPIPAWSSQWDQGSHAEERQEEKKQKDHEDGEELMSEEEWERSICLKKAEDLSKKLGLSLNPVISPRFLILSTLKPSMTEPFSKRLEKLYDDITTTLHIKRPLWQTYRKCIVLILPDREAYVKYADIFGKEYDQPAAQVRAFKRARGFYQYIAGSSPIAAECQGRRPIVEIEAGIAHKIGHIMLYRLHFRYNYLPAWLSEGFAAWVEARAVGEVLTYCFSTRYGGGNDMAVKWIEFSQWPEVLQTMVTSKTDPALKHLFGLHINDLGYKEVAKVWSFLDFLIKRDARSFTLFCKGFRKALPKYDVYISPEKYRSIQERLFVEVYGAEIEDLEEEWKELVVPKVEEDGESDEDPVARHEQKE